MTLLARICRNCERALGLPDYQCPSCGEDCQLVDLMAAYTEQGEKLNECRDELAKIKEESTA